MVAPARFERAAYSLGNCRAQVHHVLLYYLEIKPLVMFLDTLGGMG